MERLPAEHVANLRRRDQADKFLQSECREASEWGACGVLFTEKFETTSALKALSFRYRGRVSCGRDSLHWFQGHRVVSFS